MFCNIKFCVFFAPPLHGVERNIIRNPGSTADRMNLKRGSGGKLTLRFWLCVITQDSDGGQKRPRFAKFIRVLKQLAYVAKLHCTLVNCKWNNEKSQRCNVLTVLNVQMNEKTKFFKNEFFCDIHVQGAQDIRSSVKYTKFFISCPKNYPYTKII